MKIQDLKSIFENGIEYSSFFLVSDEKSKIIMEQMLNENKLSEALISRIKKVELENKFLVIGESWCPDCIINITALEYIKKLNANFIYRIISKDGQENNFTDYHYDSKLKIPTIILLNTDYSIKNAFIEVPQIVRKLENNDNQVERIKTMKDYRKGNLIEDTITEILDMIG